MTSIGSSTSVHVGSGTLLHGGTATREVLQGATSATKASEWEGRGGSPATIVDLSDRAKAVIDRAKQEQKVADQLRGQLDRATRSGATTEYDPGAEILQKYGDLPGAERWAAEARADNVGLLEAGAKTFDIGRMESIARSMKAGFEVQVFDSNMSEDEMFVVDTQLNLAMAITDLEDAGLTDRAQALRTAVASGSISFQKSSDVPELNLDYSVTHFADVGGGGTRTNWTWNPTGEARAALDNGRAYAFGAADRGAFLVSW
jgi:hypothetical protein